VEPIVGTVGSCSVAGVFQHLVLRRRRRISSKCLALWIVGLLVSLIPTALTIFLLEGPLGLSLAWPVEGFLSARWVVDRWRLDYNHQRPHSALGYQTPAAFSARYASSVRATPSLQKRSDHLTQVLSPRLD